MVQVSSTQSCLPEQKCRDVCARCGVSISLRSHESICVLKLHVNNGGNKSIRQAREVVHNGSAEELDGLAVCSAYQLPVCAVGTASDCRQHNSTRLELLSQLHQQSWSQLFWSICVILLERGTLFTAMKILGTLRGKHSAQGYC